MNRSPRLRNGLLAAAALAATLFVAPPSAQATVVVPLTRAELVDRSDLVVRATVLSQHSGWNADHSQIVTVSALRVDAWLKGTGATQLMLQQFGGSVDGLTSHVSGDATLTPGQQAVFFLRSQNGRVYLTALAQSVYYIDAGSNGQLTVRRDLSDLSFARPVNGQYQVAEAPLEIVETLEHLTADVTRLARGAR